MPHTVSGNIITLTGTLNAKEALFDGYYLVNDGVSGGPL